MERKVERKVEREREREAESQVYLHEVVHRSLPLSGLLLGDGPRSRDLSELELLHPHNLQVREIKLSNSGEK